MSKSKGFLLIVRYVILPLVIVGVAGVLFFETVSRYPVYVCSAVGLLLLVGVVRGRRKEQRDVQRGWRVGHAGRDAMYYEEFRDGAWQRMAIGGEMLVGKAHHVIYFRSLKFPEWAGARREEIIERIKSEFHPPQYEYDDT